MYIQVVRLVDSKFRLAPPPGCPRAIYAIMMSCWYVCIVIQLTVEGMEEAWEGQQCVQFSFLGVLCRGVGVYTCVWGVCVCGGTRCGLCVDRVCGDVCGVYMCVGVSGGIRCGMCVWGCVGCMSGCVGGGAPYQYAVCYIELSYRCIVSSFCTYRHPTASVRPDFHEVTQKLSLPDTKLLKWLKEDKSVHPEAAKLGADLLCGEGLYKDLQVKYKDRSK